MSELKSTLKSFFLAALLAATMSAGSSYAHDTFKRDGARQMGNSNFGARAMRNLDLSDEQTAQIEAMFSVVQETVAANREKMKDARELSEAGNVDQAAEIAATLAREKVVAQAANRQNLEAILTPEQLTELESMKGKARQRGQRGQRRGNRNTDDETS